MDRMMTVDDVAEFLKLSRSWVYKRAASGELPVRRIGPNLRFDPEEIRAYARGEWAPPVLPRRVTRRR